MSAFRFKIFLRDIAVRRFWNAWTRNYLVNTVVKRFKRDRGVREVLQCFKQVILKPRRTLLLSATAVCKGRGSFNCDQGITDDELQSLLSELENLQNLAKLTIYCTSCGKRLLIDKKQNGVSYCVCKDSKPAQNSSDGWIPYIEANDVIIWRKEYKPGQGLYAYKVYGRYMDVSASDFAAVQLDGAYRRAWDGAVAALSVVQRGAHGLADQAVLHWEVLWPRLFANRDYVYVRRHKEFDLSVKQDQQDAQAAFTSVHAKAKRKALEGDSVDAGNKVRTFI
ncbi:stAR-related lipid transfer protein 7, mitochondrial-like [Zerene cesonia]|uniref:stAR-related lipid transfer protein 7, mitochondrial-like n=1 Tax=Zerene cesonia TaxID=33412 RepID=UPI0018E557B8|nr:stAR-related lipid transfer protein 7, mitochondrial-like [Zerene cesonia]